MAPIEWKDSYRTGVDAVDHEHRELIDLMNRLDAVLTAPDKADDAEEIFGELFRAISSHFALEERFMREHRYDQLSDHKRDHERLLDDLRDMMDEYAQAGRIEDESAVRAFMKRVEDWFGNHFRTHDARLHGRLGAHPHRTGGARYRRRARRDRGPDRALRCNRTLTGPHRFPGGLRTRQARSAPRSGPGWPHSSPRYSVDRDRRLDSERRRGSRLRGGPIMR